MSSDNFIIINLKNFRVTYGQGDGRDKPIKCKTLEEAVEVAQTIDASVGGTEYGVVFINSLKK